jgi:hypothetical protein
LGDLLDRSDQFSKVLNRCDQQILDRLFDQPPAASALETMSVGGVSKTAFHQMLPAFPIESGSLGVNLSTRSIQEVLIAMAFNAAARFGTGAELPQPETQTHPSLGNVFLTEAHRVQPPWLHHLTSRAQEGVTLWSIEELRF